ncbi:32-trans-enoyl-coa isomerase-related [Holotrichia oblita]|uniref:32-trans-enoyl-coa isomerase-related n=1 Tax=Holotrichia oblita TaxID=644536 RepID=A0ACB9TWA5_HOLOL|nr:32-trans-enoyl-coa isomerase-related [Holotrichia oblita]
MDSNPGTLDLDIPQVELSVSSATITPNVDVETSVLAKEKIVDIIKESDISNTTPEVADAMHVEDVLQNVEDNKLEPVQTTEAVTNIETAIVVTDVETVQYIVPENTSINEAVIDEENIQESNKKNDLMVDSRNGEVLTSAIETNHVIQDIVGPTTTEEAEVDKNATASQKKEDDLTLEKLIESTLENADSNLPNPSKETTETNTTKTEDVILVAVDVDTTTSTKANDENKTADIQPEIILDEQDTDNTEEECQQSEQTEIVRDVEATCHTELQKEDNVIIDHEFTNIPQEDIVESQEISTEDNICLEQNAQEQIGEVTDLDTISNTEQNIEITKASIINNDMIEAQISNIVQHEEQTSPPSKSGESISIAEAISRDFDETDPEDVDKSETVGETKTVEVSDDNVMVGVSINDEEHGTLTVTNTSGEVYYVQYVDNLTVVENDIGDQLNEPETVVTVVTDLDHKTQSESVRSKDKSSIPSHILGRSIDNPVIDTFRNGRVPPKPRLGVKIPYKNLTSQIVSKDEIAQEILERQKKKNAQSGQTVPEMLFAKKLTQRLAKKIAPTDDPISVSEEIVATCNRDETINNSDLLAILEGDGEDSDVKRAVDAEVVSTSKSETALDSKSDTIIKTIEQKKQKAPMSKTIERELALKQLKELPVSIRRKRSLPGSRHKDFPYILIENELNLEGDTPTTTNSPQKDKQDSEKAIHPKTHDKAPSNDPKLIQPSPSIEQQDTAPTDSKSKNREVNNVVITKTQQSDVKQTQLRSETIMQQETNREETEVKVKPNENKQIIPSDQVKLQSVKTDNIKVSNIEILANVELQENPNKIKDNEKEVQSAATSSTKVTSGDAKTSAIVKPNEKSKQNDVPAKLVKTEGKVADSSPKQEYVERKHIGGLPIKTYTRKRKSTEDITVTSSVPDKKPTVIRKDSNIPPNTYITKSSRIIKRKVIWDPDEPSTARSLAARSPKVDVKSEKPVKSDTVVVRVDKKPVIKSVVKTETKSPVKSPDSQKIKKRLSEIDKLLMDEGAVNMLYAVKNVDEATKRKKINVISLDKAQKELMNKTNELKKDLKTNSDKVSPKSLRRKESPVPTPTKKIIPASVSRKKSKDSNRSSLHSPPASPGMMYVNHADASRIIRRHSSSSYSSMEGDFDPERKSDVDVQAPDNERISKKRIASLNTEGVKLKRLKRSNEKENVVVADKSKINEETSKNFNKLVESEQKKEIKYDKYKTFSVKQMDHMVQIILLPSFNSEVYLTPEILNELCAIMKELQDDANCTVVAISSSASSFCHGINYKTLLIEKEQSRRAFAQKLATCVTYDFSMLYPSCLFISLNFSNFLGALAKFPKILVAGVHGDTVGLGVTILPLFDMVIASDTATFSIPNARLGCAAEGGSLLSLPHLMHNVLVSELLYASRKLIAAEALRLGMVTRVLWPDKFQQEFVSIVRGISNQSPQFMQLTKKQLRLHMMEHIEEVLSTEVETLTQHWISSECQRNFGVYG